MTRTDAPPAEPTFRPETPRRVLAARTGVAVVFILNGLSVAAWFSRLPTARDALGLSPGRLGLLLLAMSGGAVLALVTAGVVVQRLGAARTVAAATMLIAVGLTGAGIATSQFGSVALVAMMIFLLGYGLGTADVAMNVEAAAVERRLGRTIMPRFHAGWSLGSVAGAALGAGAAQVGLPIAVHLVLVAAVVLGGTLFAVRFFLSVATPAGDASTGPAGDGTRVPPSNRPRSAWREPRTLLIGLFTLMLAFTEGSANDWVAVAFIDGYDMGEAAGAAVFGVFVVGMTLGRTVGTVALDRWGRIPVLTGTILLAMGGSALAVLAGNGPLAVVGVACWGVGASLGFPIGMSAAADDEERAPARVSVVAAVAYTAFLAGPPLIGLLGDRIGTLPALLTVPVLLVFALALVPVIRPPAANACCSSSTACSSLVCRAVRSSITSSVGSSPGSKPS